MKKHESVLRASVLFSGISADELETVLTCLGARTERYPRGAFLMRAGDRAESIGFVLEGAVLVVQEDIWGNRSILARTGAGQTFGTAYACAPGAVLNVSVEAETAAEVLYLNVRRVLTVCSAACTHHARIVRNLLGELAENNLRLSEKVRDMGQRTTRAKLASYLSAEAQRQGSREFDIPFSRQQLADYLAVERSGLSAELGRLRDEGLLEFDRNHFLLKTRE